MEGSNKMPFMSDGPSLYRSPSERMPLDLFSYTREAGNCLNQHHYLAAITLSSIAVELLLNRDRRLKSVPGYRGASNWANLNNNTLKIARDHGMPVHCLLGPDDDLESSKPVAFVALRNKVAHGEVNGLLSTLSDYDPAAAQMATLQERKMRKFVAEWFNTSPDIRDGHIVGHMWP